MDVWRHLVVGHKVWQRQRRLCIAARHSCNAVCSGASRTLSPRRRKRPLLRWPFILHHSSADQCAKGGRLHGQVPAGQQQAAAPGCGLQAGSRSSNETSGMPAAEVQACRRRCMHAAMQRRPYVARLQQPRQCPDMHRAPYLHCQRRRLLNALLACWRRNKVTLNRLAGMGSRRSGAMQRSAAAKAPQRAGSQVWVARGPMCQEATLRHPLVVCLARDASGHMSRQAHPFNLAGEQGADQTEGQRAEQAAQMLLLSLRACLRRLGVGWDEERDLPRRSPAQLLEAVGKSACQRGPGGQREWCGCEQGHCGPTWQRTWAHECTQRAVLRLPPGTPAEAGGSSHRWRAPSITGWPRNSVNGASPEKPGM